MNSKKERVSVIIPTFNYARFLKDCIESVLRQSCQPVEVIVIDDGSQDNTSEVVNQFGKKVKYIYQENKGLSAARNTGLRLCSGDYIQFLDSDDLLGDSVIEQKVRFLKANPHISIAVCRNYLYFSYKSDGGPKVGGQWFLHRANLDVHLMFANIAPPHAFFINRAVVEDVGFFDEELKACEDYDYWLRAALRGYVPNYCRNGVVYYRRHAESMSAKLFNQYYHDALLNFRVFSNFFETGLANISSAHWLAFWAGLLTTCGRLELRQHFMHDDLCSLALKSFELGRPVLENNPAKFGGPTLSYWAIIQRRLAELRKSDDPRMLELLNNVDFLEFSSVFGGLPKSKDLLRIIPDWQRDPIDFLTLSSSFYRYVKNQAEVMRLL